MTNFDSFTKPIIHFGNADQPRPVELTPQEESK